MKIRNLLCKPALHDEARALLDRYHCPVPFHAVRTRFLGQSLSLSASPLDVVRSRWGGVLPEFEDHDARNELMRTLMVGLWDELARHRDKGSPFQLVRMAVPSTRKGLVEIAVVRGEELNGFAEGVSGATGSLPLPRRPQFALKVLSFLRSLFADLHRLASDPAKLTMGDVAEIYGRVPEMTKTGEHMIYEFVRAAARSRRQLLNMVPTTKPTVH
jgi:hypothetical protein